MFLFLKKYYICIVLNFTTMKKTILIALAGIMIFAFTQCSSGESKAYKDVKSMYENFGNACKKAKTCEELDAVAATFFEDMFTRDYDYAENEKATPEEKEKLKDLLDKVVTVYEQRAADLNCGDKILK